MMVRWRFLLLAFASSLALAQLPPPPAEAPAFSQPELDQMLAPIALYPDELLSQILMAATYPLEIVEAARWLAAHPGMQGEAAVNAAASETWDPSVKSLLAFPQILSMMDRKLEWTQRLGNAFLAQQQQVMETVQELRRRAYAQGNLRSTDREVVEDREGSIVVVPANPRIVYVPYYDPFFVYGPWWWPAYPPVYWAPWPGYVVAPLPGFWWGVGIGISFGFFYGAVDWPHHHVVIVRPPLPIYHPPAILPPPGAWRHDPAHRRNVPYRSEAARREFARPPPPAGVSPPRLEYRGRQPPAQVPPRAFEGIRQGGERTREYSQRGQSSLSAPRAPPASAPRAAPAPRGPAPSAVPRGGAPRGGATGGHR